MTRTQAGHGRDSGAEPRKGFDAAKLVAEARRATGLEDFGGPPVEPALAVLADSLEREAGLHRLGRFLMRVHLLDLLKIRLRLADAWRKQPEAELAPIERPIVITGAPRTGSTFLHELLAEDPALRAPRIWEVMAPLSANAPDRGWRDLRVWKAAHDLWWFRRLAPGADAVYPMRARTPHECVAIHSYTLISEEFVSSCRVPAYEAFLRAADLAPVYRWQKRFLQHLQRGQPGRRWVLKAPDHVYGLDALLSVFPDATVVVTHRDPMQVLKSSIQLNAVLRGLYGRPDAPQALARREARVLAEAGERVTSFRAARPELADQFVDVDYRALTADPLAAVERIFARAGQRLGAEGERRMRAFAARRSRYRGRRPVKDLAEVGLDEPALERLLASVRE